MKSFIKTHYKKISIGVFAFIILIVLGFIFLSPKNQPQPNTARNDGPAIPETPYVESKEDPKKETVKESAESTEKPTLFLPFLSPIPDSITPMGETIYHPKPQNPNGHEGIDYQWANPASVPDITASMDGEIVYIGVDTGKAGRFRVNTKSGIWGVDYTELEALNDSLRLGDKVKAGDKIGIPQHPDTITDQPNFRMIHWHFGYNRGSGGSGVDQKVCPLNYFDATAKTTIESMWAKTKNENGLKENAPEICSGVFNGKNE